MFGISYFHSVCLFFFNYFWKRERGVAASAPFYIPISHFQTSAARINRRYGSKIRRHVAFPERLVLDPFTSAGRDRRSDGAPQQQRRKKKKRRKKGRHQPVKALQALEMIGQ